jgi:hypothetical protein
MMLCQLVSFVGLMDACDDGNLGRILKIDEESENIEGDRGQFIMKWEGSSVTKGVVVRLWRIRRAIISIYVGLSPS